jgi:glycosyltransferase involved in cell wall biosynthesis
MTAPCLLSGKIAAMRIAQLTGEFPPLQGGVGDFTFELSRALAHQGHDVHVVTTPADGALRQETLDGVQVHRIIPKWGWDVRKRVEAFARVHPIDALNIQYQAAAYAMHPAVNLLPGGLTGRIRTIVTFHDLLVPYLFPKAGPLRWKAVLSMARGAAAAIVTNDEDLAKLRAEGLTTAHLAPIGSNVAPADLTGFDRAAWLRARGIDPARTLIGYFGFMNRSKGGDALMRALAELVAGGVDAAVLHIGGQTGASDPTNVAYAQELRALGAELGVADRWIETGFLAAADVSAGFAACACLALPYRDGASYRRGTLMAGLAHGCAIVSTHPRVAVPAFVDGANMLLTAPDDSPALAASIRSVLSDSALRERLRAGAKAISAQFEWPAIARTTAAVLGGAATQ